MLQVFRRCYIEDTNLYVIKEHNTMTQVNVESHELVTYPKGAIPPHKDIYRLEADGYEAMYLRNRFPNLVSSGPIVVFRADLAQYVFNNLLDEEIDVDLSCIAAEHLPKVML